MTRLRPPDSTPDHLIPHDSTVSGGATVSGPSYVRLSDGDVIKVEGCDWTLE
ncbi:hypothetical protein [Nocardia nova]|uniref:hypothetical protein n=1 Tax=Nocardia nova TaxID=37330 RepID=UPI00340532C0